MRMIRLVLATLFLALLLPMTGCIVRSHHHHHDRPGARRVYVRDSDDRHDRGRHRGHHRGRGHRHGHGHGHGHR